MGYAGRLNPRSLDGRKPYPWVERARLEVAPVAALVRVLASMTWRRLRGV